MDYRQWARPYEWRASETCSVVLWFLPFRHIDCDITLNALNALEPQGEYVHGKTKERVTEEPEELKRQKRNTKAKGVPLKTEWTYQRHWNGVHDVFWQILPCLVAVDFPDFDAATPSCVRAFAAFYPARAAAVAQRWQDFRMILATETFNALSEGYDATRDNPMPASEEMSQATPPDDPLLEAAGMALETSMSAS